MLSFAYEAVASCFVTMTTTLATALMGLFAFTGNTGAIATEEVYSHSVAPAPVNLSVKATAYNAVPEQTDADPFTTASGLPTNPEIVAARSRDLADILPFGTIIAVEAPESVSASCGMERVSEQIGYRVILDVMHARKKAQVDVLLNENNTIVHAGKDRNPAEVLGICDGVTVRVVGQVDLMHVPETQAELAALVEGKLLARN